MNTHTRAQRWLRRFGQTMAAFSYNLHTFRNHCETCQDVTPWLAHAWSGTYRCTRCGSALGKTPPPADAPTT